MIPNAVFNPAIKRIRRPDKRDNYISAMGRLVCEIKGFDVLIRAFASISLDFPEIKLRIFGYGKDYEKLLNISKECNCSSRVQLIAGNENAIEEVAKSKIFVLSSNFEGYPNALLEAMACGVPCIATDCQFGPSDIIDNGENGLLVNVANEKQLAKALRFLLNRPDLAEKMGICAEKYKITNSIDNIARLWEKEFEKIVG